MKVTIMINNEWKNGGTALMSASKNGHIDVVNKLIKMKVNIEAAKKVSGYHNECENNA